MKILYTLYPLWPDKPGGMEIHVLDLVREMKARAHEVYVVCPPGKISDWYENEGAKVNRLKMSLDIDPIYIWKLSKYIRQHQFDIIHSHDLKSTTASFIASLSDPKAKFVSHTHTPVSEWFTPNIIKEIYKRCAVVLYSVGVNLLSDKEIALTQHIKKIKEHKGISSQKITVIPNAVDYEKFSQIQRGEFKREICEKYNISTDSFIFGYVSRMSDEKGHDTLIEAFNEIVKNNLVHDQNITLLLCGGGVLENQLRTKVEELGLEDKVKMTGVFDEQLKPKFYSSFDAFVFPSRAEGFGIVLLEAMSAGLPILCSNLPVLEEVAGPTAFYFDTGNSADLAQKMKDLYLRKDNLELMGRNAQERVKDLYTYSKFGDAYEHLYQSLLEKK